MAHNGETTGAEYPDDATVVCGICGREFESERALERHVRDAGLLY